MSIMSINEIIPKTDSGKGRAAALCGGFLISFDSIFIRTAGISGADTVFLFGIFSAISMAILIQLTDKRGFIKTLKDSGWPLILSALLIVGSSSTFILSIRNTSVANTVFILSARPILTALAAWIFMHEKTSKALWLSIFGLIAGIYIVVNGSLTNGNIMGDGYALCAVSCVSINGAVWRKYSDMSRLAVVGTGGFFLAIAMFFQSNPSQIPPESWLIMAAMGIASAPIGRVMNALSSRYIPSSEMATLTLISTVLAPIWALFFFNEHPPVTTLLGGMVIFISIGSYLFLTRPRLSRAKAFRNR